MENVKDGTNATKENAPAVTKQTGTPKNYSYSTKKTKAHGACHAIEIAFRSGEWLTDREAHYKYQCKRFRNVLSELRERSWLFFDEWVSDVNEYGHSIRYKRYRLLKAGA